jgi:hypothetical protein
MIFPRVQYLHVPVELTDRQSFAVGRADRTFPVIDKDDL